MSAAAKEEELQEAKTAANTAGQNLYSDDRMNWGA